MKNKFMKLGFFIMAVMLLGACKKFDSLTVNPTAANESQVQVEYFINNAIINAQMDPHIAERVFVLYWQRGGHQTFEGTGIVGGGYNDGWSSDYYRYLSNWLNPINTAVQVAETKISSGDAQPYTLNMLQVARIWRVYLMSEFADNFGPMPINGFQGLNPTFSDLKTVYYYFLDELKDANSKLDPSKTVPADTRKLDAAFGFDFAKWKKYANSMRLRLAMRISEVDPAKAKSEFEAAATGDLLKSVDDIFQVQEQPGWDALTGVMSREWNYQWLSSTMNRLYIGLGGIASADQLGAAYQSAIKPANYIGIKYDQQFPTMTNAPEAPYWLDGLPNIIDPRAYKTYIIPGDFTNPDYCTYPSWDDDAETTTGDLRDAAGNKIATIDGKFTWNAYPGGDWGAKDARNDIRWDAAGIPRMAQKFRASGNKRIFFAPWETYFLLAEAAVKGWSVPMTGQAAYEEGIKASFSYWGVSSFASSYISSSAYNRNGTSVSWAHTTEPPASMSMNYKDGYTNATGTVNIAYPKNDIYKNGTVKNDLLTKIITQKFIAQVPYLPLEGWSDQRRLGLPFFENPVIENLLPNLPALTASNYMTSNVKFFPQRLRYPSGLKNSNQAGYDQAVVALGGADEVLTPLWWAKKQ